MSHRLKCHTKTASNRYQLSCTKSGAIILSHHVTKTQVLHCWPCHKDCKYYLLAIVSHRLKCHHINHCITKTRVLCYRPCHKDSNYWATMSQRLRCFHANVTKTAASNWVITIITYSQHTHKQHNELTNDVIKFHNIFPSNSKKTFNNQYFPKVSKTNLYFHRVHKVSKTILCQEVFYQFSK